MKALVVAFTLAMVTLAGCTSPSDDMDPTGTDGTDDEGPFQMQKPEWQVGDWWSYTSGFGDHTLVVTEDNGASWTVDTDNENYAFFTQVLGEISYIGEIRKSDLAGSQDGTPVQFFDWPLEHNKQWTATWDGLDLDMVAHVSDTGIAHVIASQDDVTVNQFVYDEAVGWFTEMIWNDPETGEEFGSMELEESGSNFTGELVRVDAELVVEEAGNGPTGGLQTITIPSFDDADLYLGFTTQCPSIVETVGSAYFFAMGPVENIPGIAGDAGAQNDDGFNYQGECPDGFAFFGVIGEFPGEGTWGYTMDAPDPHLTYSIQLWMRHFERVVL